jgi:hypothetical protein
MFAWMFDVLDVTFVDYHPDVPFFRLEQTQARQMHV